MTADLSNGADPSDSADLSHGAHLSHGADPADGALARRLDRDHVFHSWSAQATLSPLVLAGGAG
ncbi:MAG: hypothetical protein QOH55_1960, partial [Microbacteriaceae bacterium]|nr:hypothetical protein [Microbacteriaceae bacterium]